MKKLLFSLVSFCAFVAPAFAQQDTVVEEIVARVNNAIITRADLRRNHEQNAQDSREMNLTQEQIEQRDANSLRDLIDQQLLLQKAADLGISADADLIRRLDDLRKEMKVGSMEELQKIAEAQGISFEEYKQSQKNGILTQKVIGSEVGSHIQVTREETQKFYDDHKEELSRPERVRLSEILVPVNSAAAKAGADAKKDALQPTPEQVAAAQAKADEIYQQLKNGAKFDELARKESGGTTAEQGGDLGYFKRKDLAKELEDKSFALKTGEFTEPIRTRQGFIILRVADHIQAGTPTLEAVREQIMEQLYSQKVQPALREFLTKLREQAYIDIKPGYSDSGASPNQTKLVYTSDSGPKTKQVRGKMGVGHKKTVVVSARDRKTRVTANASNTSALGTAKSEVDAKEKAALEKKAAEQAAAAKAKADAEEKEKLSKMTKKERERYLAQKKRTQKYNANLEKKETRKERKLEKKEKRQEAEQARREKENAKAIAKGKKPPYATKADEKAATEQQDPNAPPKKKKISWF